LTAKWEITTISFLKLKSGLAFLILVLGVILASCQGIPEVSKSNSFSTTTSTNLTFIPANSTASTVDVYFLDVVQGDSEIIKSGNSTMLIDAGTNASTNTLISDIKKLGISQFDIVVGTYPSVPGNAALRESGSGRNEPS
jgi:beta-lactamase superfamily II metal-dependent hydrolase